MLEKLLEKINKYVNEKNEKYYREFLNNCEKRKKVKILQEIMSFFNRGFIEHV